MIKKICDLLWKLTSLVEISIEKIYRVLVFNQCQWLKQYVEFNTQKRTEQEKIATKMEKRCKLMTNSVYGKKKKKTHLKWTSNPNYIWHKIFDNDLVAIRKNIVTLTLDKPVYIGMCLLELSKVLMYEFHYDLSWFDDKMYIQNSGCDGLALDY